MLKSVKQFFALSLCLLMLLPFVSAAFVDPGNTVAPCDGYSCSHSQAFFDMDNYYYKNVEQPPAANRCLGSYYTFKVYPCRVCSGEMYLSHEIAEHNIPHTYEGARCKYCGWLITDDN